MSYLVSAIVRSNSNCFLFQRLSGQKILSRIPAPRRTVITTYYRVVSPGFNFISCGGLFMLDVPDVLVFFPLNFVLTMKSWTQNRSLNMVLILELGKRPRPQSNTLIVARFNFIFSDHDFIQEQENRLLLMCKRTMALPVGRCGQIFALRILSYLWPALSYLWKKCVRIRRYRRRIVVFTWNLFSFEEGCLQWPPLDQYWPKLFQFHHWIWQDGPRLGELSCIS